MQKKNNKKKVKKKKFKKWMKKVKTVGKIEHLRKVLFIRNSMIKSRAKNSHTRASTHTHTHLGQRFVYGVEIKFEIIIQKLSDCAKFRQATVNKKIIIIIKIANQHQLLILQIPVKIPENQINKLAISLIKAE